MAEVLHTRQPGDRSRKERKIGGIRTAKDADVV